MAAHRYWRLHITSAVGGYCSMVEVQGYTSTDGSGTNFLLGTVTADSTRYSNPPSVLVDGNTTNNVFWASSSGSSNEWVSFDLGVGVTQDLKSFTMYGRNDSFYNQAPSSGDWQYSDDNTSWTTAFSFTTTWTGANQSFTFPPFTLVGAYYDIANKTSAMALNSSATVATSSGAASVAVNRPLSGLSYAEFVITTLTGTPVVGLVNPSYNMSTATLLGGEANSLGYRSGGAVLANGVTLTTLAAFVQGDRIDMAVDPDNRLVWFRVNGGNWNNDVITNQNPVGAIGGIDASSIAFTRSLIAVGASLTGTVITAHWLVASFVGTPPTGYSSVSVIQFNTVRGSPYYIEPPVAAITYGPIARNSAAGRAVSIISPAGTITTVGGTIKENGVIVAGRRVDVYDRNTGELLGTTTSAADGTWSLPGVGRASVRVVGSDPTTFNSIVYDNVIPL